MRRLIRMYQTMRLWLLLFIGIGAFNSIMDLVHPMGNDSSLFVTIGNWFIVIGSALCIFMISKQYPRNPRYIYVNEEGDERGRFDSSQGKN